MLFPAGEALVPAPGKFFKAVVHVFGKKLDMESVAVIVKDEPIRWCIYTSARAINNHLINRSSSLIHQTVFLFAT